MPERGASASRIDLVALKLSVACRTEIHVLAFNGIDSDTCDGTAPSGTRATLSSPTLFAMYRSKVGVAASHLQTADDFLTRFA